MGEHCQSGLIHRWFHPIATARLATYFMQILGETHFKWC